MMGGPPIPPHTRAGFAQGSRCVRPQVQLVWEGALCVDFLPDQSPFPREMTLQPPNKRTPRNTHLLHVSKSSLKRFKWSTSVGGSVWKQTRFKVSTFLLHSVQRYLFSPCTPPHTVREAGPSHSRRSLLLTCNSSPSTKNSSDDCSDARDSMSSPTHVKGSSRFDACVHPPPRPISWCTR